MLGTIREENCIIIKVTVQDHIDQLKKKKEELLQEQDRLIEELKTKPPDAYTWMTDHKIDARNLAIYGANIATALVLIIKPGEFSLKWVPPAPDVSMLTPMVKVIEVDELTGKTEDEKLSLVKERYGHIVDRVAKKYDLDPKLIYATIMLESGGNTYAIRSEPSINDASYGLGQILYGTARMMGFEGTSDKLFDPEVNIELIGRYHKRNQDAYGGELTPQQLTIAYNSGSPYNYPYPGHMTKFEKWFEKVGNLLV